MNMYELMVMYRSGLKEDEVKKNISELNKKITDLKGKVVSEDYWGLKDLAYEIDKSTKAYYNVSKFEMEPESLKEFTKWITMQEGKVLREMITKLNKKVIKNS